MHKRGVEKRQQKQPIAAAFTAYSRTFHRIFTALSTGRPAEERLPARCSFTTNARCAKVPPCATRLPPEGEQFALGTARRAHGRRRDLAAGASAGQTRPGPFAHD